MSAESPRHVRSGGPLTIPSQPPSDRSIIDAVSGFISDVTLSSSSSIDPKDVIQWARFETADINEPTPEGDSDTDISPLLLILGYGSGVQVWLIPPSGEAQEVLSWRQGTVRVLRILPTPQHGDCYASKRPLIALCDSASPGPSFCSLSFISIRGGEQVKSIKFKNPILDVVANKRSVVVAFSERFAVFDAGTFEDRVAVTTCYPCPDPLGGVQPANPLALGDRWLAYADKKLHPSKRSSGGCEGEGVTSYTATVLHAAKSLSKGLRGLGETVAHSLSGGRSTSQSPSPPNADVQQPGVVTILDIEGNDEEDGQDSEEVYEPIVAHFVAHSEAIMALKFDASGMLLVTADRRGHDFHVFRINPHPCGPSLASVHHLYILHRGDTTAKVQDIAISPDSRWTAISTLRGTTHVFAISPYGGACGVRTHTQPRVVNRLSRFHRSAGLPIHAATAPPRSGSPVGDSISHGAWFPNPRLPPYPLPTTASPLAQLRPTANLPTHTITRTSSGRQRLSSLSEEGGSAPLLARARFGLAAGVSGASPRATPAPALYLMAANGSLLHLVLHPRVARSVPKEKICDESPIELEVEPLAQWPLQRPPAAADLLAPLPPSNPLLQPLSCRRCADLYMSEEERWLSQVEIVTHAGPHRRLWMGPQFVFKTYNCTGSNSSLSEAETVEIETSTSRGVARSTPMNMPGARPLVPVIVDSGSASSLEHSPSDSFRRKSLLAEGGRAPSLCDVQLKEDLAEAMKEDHGCPREEPRRGWQRSAGVVRAVDPLGTVVVPSEAPDPIIDDPDLYTTSNADEATFRPVVRAPAAIALHPDMIIRPLPRETTIPVQTVTPSLKISPEVQSMPLNTDVVIPAALSFHPPEVKSANIDTKKDTTKVIITSMTFTDKQVVEQDRPVESVHIASNETIENIDFKKFNISKDLKQIDECKRDVECERSSGVAERAMINKMSLPKFNQLSDDIHPIAGIRLKKSPTPKLISDKDVSDVSIKNKHIEESYDLVEDQRDKTIENQHSNELIQSQELKETVGTKLKEKEQSTMLNQSKLFEEIPIIMHTEDPKQNELEKTVENKEFILPNKRDSLKLEQDVNINENTKKSKKKTEIVEAEIVKDDSLIKTSNILFKQKCESKMETIEMHAKSEEQAWDMLLSVPEKPAVLNDKSFSVIEKCTQDPKPKTRRRKKNYEDCVDKADDSFVEVHAIEEKPQPAASQLVSISTHFENTSCSSYNTSKNKKASLNKTSVCGIKEKFEEIYTQQNTDLYCKPGKNKDDSNFFDISAFCEPLLTSNMHQPKTEPEDLKLRTNTEDHFSENNLLIKEEPSKYATRKSLSPYSDNRKQKDDIKIDQKDVYVINSSIDDFPEIQITKGTRTRFRSPQTRDKKRQEKEVIDKPTISWSAIAANKGVKKARDVDKKDDFEGEYQKQPKEEIKYVKKHQSTSSCKEVSLRDKLIELCKSPDIVVAECDVPTELNFVEEHHSIVHDLPPLEPLDFGLNSFKLDAKKDSLLETQENKITSPICKINIDDILYSIKETTNKAIESSVFNLVDLEKVPIKNEKGFSIVEEHKITTHEVQLDDDYKLKEKGVEVMEKSSDEDPSPMASTDSDKDDRKHSDPCNVVPQTRLSAKAKKSRRKKK